MSGKRQQNSILCIAAPRTPVIEFEERERSVGREQEGNSKYNQISQNIAISSPAKSTNRSISN
jgi:hypothetical protein